MSVGSDGRRSSPQGSSSRPWSGMPGPCCIAVQHSQGEARLDDLWVRPGWCAGDGAEAATHSRCRSVSSTSTQDGCSSTLTWPRGAMPGSVHRGRRRASGSRFRTPLWASDGGRKRPAGCPFPVNPSPAPDSELRAIWKSDRNSGRASLAEPDTSGSQRIEHHRAFVEECIGQGQLAFSQR